MAGPDVPFSNVIVGIDGLQGGRDAIALARILAAPDARLALAHVRASLPEAAPGTGDAGEGRGSADAQAEREDCQRLLERERETAKIDAQLEIVKADSPGRGLHELAARQDADLLVVGSSHRGFVGRVLLGDSTRESLNGAPCAVGVAPLDYARVLTPLKRIGVGYDRSPESKTALQTARELAARSGASIKVLQVVQMLSSAYAGWGGAAWGEALEAVISDTQHELDALEGVEGEALLGVAGEALSELGDRVDLLVVGSRGYGPVRTLVLGSTSQHLAKHARCPLVVLPRGAEDDDGVQ